jgi:hypothetical protein
MSYRLNAVVQQLRDLARATDVQLEDAIADFVVALEDDGVVDESEFRGILISLTRSFRGNANALSILNLLDESGSEAALREVERVQAKFRRHPAEHKPS